jgi:hypothetical protein
MRVSGSAGGSPQDADVDALAHGVPAGRTPASVVSWKLWQAARRRDWKVVLRMSVNVVRPRIDGGVRAACPQPAGCGHARPRRAGSRHDVWTTRAVYIRPTGRERESGGVNAASRPVL